MTTAPLSIAVIGGLAAALALSRAGFAVAVYEQAPQLTQIGGGINMAPNATRVLYRLGLAAGLDREGVRPLGLRQRRWNDGRTLQSAPLNPLCEQLYGAPHLTIHRADLLAVIAAGLPAERIHLGHRLVGLADRGLVPIERVADPDLARGSQSWLGPGAHLVHYPVARGRLLNFVGWTEHDRWNREDWTDRATPSRALAAFAGWHPQVRRIIAAADTCFIWALFDRDPLPRWSVGRTSLLGDACHPMYPFMGQGAAMAIEDGAVLAACLAGIADPVAALKRYEQLRLPRVTRLQAMSRANKARFHMRDGPEQQARDAEWARAADRSPQALRWLYAFDADALAPECA